MTNVIKQDMLLCHIASKPQAMLNCCIGIALQFFMVDDTLMVRIEGITSMQPNVLSLPCGNSDLILFLSENMTMLHGVVVSKDEISEVMIELEELWNTAQNIQIEHRVKMMDGDIEVGSSFTLIKGQIKYFRLALSDTVMSYTTLGLGDEIGQKGYPDYSAVDTDLFKENQEKNLEPKKENNNDAS